MNKNILEYRKIRNQAAPIVPQTWAVARRIWKEERIKFINYLTAYKNFMSELPDFSFAQGERVVPNSLNTGKKSVHLLRSINFNGKKEEILVGIKGESNLGKSGLTEGLINSGGVTKTIDISPLLKRKYMQDLLQKQEAVPNIMTEEMYSELTAKIQEALNKIKNE